MLTAFDTPSLISSLSYGSIFLSLVANGIIGFPSSQIIYIVTGVFVGKGSIAFIPAVIVGALGNTIGNMITFGLVRHYGEDIIKKFFLVKKEYLHEFKTQVEKKGIWLLFVGKLTPSLKVLVPFVAGIARIKYLTASLLFFTSSLIWATAFISIGYFFGNSITPKSYALVMFFIGLIVAYLFYIKIIKTNTKKK